jgi:hypothetical protein
VNHRFAGVTPYERAARVYVTTRNRDAVRQSLSTSAKVLDVGSLAELLFGGRDPELGPLNELSPLTTFQPWMPRVKTKGRFLDTLDNEAEMIIRAVEFLERSGYQPEIHPRGYVSGYFLLDRGDYRFLIQDGQHRVSAMLAIAAPREITVRIGRNVPAVVSAEEVRHWPMVRDGTCPAALALKLLRRHFTPVASRD